MAIAMTKPLADLKADATNRINKASDGYLERAFPFVYASPNQMAAFLTTVDECKSYIAAGSPVSLTNYPYLQEAKNRNPDQEAASLANGIILLHKLWSALQSQITLGASAAIASINDATNAEGIYTAEQNYYAAMEALWT